MNKRKLLIALAALGLCLSYCTLRVQAAAGDDVHHYKVDLKDDFEDATGEYRPKAVGPPPPGSPTEGQIGGGVDEFNNYDLEAEVSPSAWGNSLSGARHRLELSSEETQSFFLSLAMIIVSEIGDKTFLIAAIMAMKHPRLLVFSSALSALAVMTILSAAFGHAVPNLISRKYTNILAALLFFCFGIRMFIDGWNMTEEEAAHELEEVTQELQEKEDLELLQRAEGGVDAADGDASLTPAAAKKKESSGIINLLQLLFSPVFVQTFIMTFLAEWGDRSQIATIALAAAHNMAWVSIGGIFGHSLCTGVAVIGGRMLATRISVRTVTLAGAVMFELFAIVSLYESLYE